LRSRNVLWMHDVKYVYIGRRGGGIVQSKGVKWRSVRISLRGCEVV
jgi:hypothetical protein